MHQLIDGRARSGDDMSKDVDVAADGEDVLADLNDEVAAPSRRRWHAVGWAGVGVMSVGGAILATSGALADAGLAWVAAAVVASWTLDYRGRVHRWPSLLGDAAQRRSSNE